MLLDSDIIKFMNAIPSIPKTVKECSNALNQGDLVKAASIAKLDKALIEYLKNIVNKPIFGFRDEINDTKQIFGILGLSRAIQILDSYYVELITPKKWYLFNLETKSFQDLQADMLIRWEALLSSINVNDINISRTITLIPATIVVCEEIFKSKIEILELLRTGKQISYEEILKKSTGKTFFDIASLIAKKWEMSKEVITLMNSLNNQKKVVNTNEILEYMSLLIEYELSRPKYMQSGLNDFFDLEIDVPSHVVDNFLKVMNKI